MITAAFQTVVEGPYGLARIESMAGSVVRTFWDSRIRQFAQLILGSGSFAYTFGRREQDAHGLGEWFGAPIISFFGAIFGLTGIFWNMLSASRKHPCSVILDMESFNAILRDPLIGAVVAWLDTMAISATLPEIGADEERLSRAFSMIGAGWLVYRAADITLCHGNASFDLVARNFEWLGDIKEALAKQVIDQSNRSIEIWQAAGIDLSNPFWQMEYQPRVFQCLNMAFGALLGGAPASAIVRREEYHTPLWTATISASALFHCYIATTKLCYFPLTAEVAKRIAAYSAVLTLDALACSSAIWLARGEENPLVATVAIAWLLHRTIDVACANENCSKEFFLGNTAPLKELYTSIWSWLPEV